MNRAVALSMPPKKRAATTPIVVGTVSTRSTRRQSVVNIDIPKLNAKTRKSARNGVKQSKKPSKSGKRRRNEIEIEIDEPSSEDFTMPSSGEAQQMVKELLEEWCDQDSDVEDEEDSEGKSREEESSQDNSEIILEAVDQQNVTIECVTEDVTSLDSSEFSVSKSEPDEESSPSDSVEDPNSILVRKGNVSYQFIISEDSESESKDNTTIETLVIDHVTDMKVITDDSSSSIPGCQTTEIVELESKDTEYVEPDFVNSEIVIQEPVEDVVEEVFIEEDSNLLSGSSQTSDKPVFESSQNYVEDPSHTENVINEEYNKEVIQSEPEKVDEYLQEVQEENSQESCMEDEEVAGLCVSQEQVIQSVEEQIFGCEDEETEIHTSIQDKDSTYLNDTSTTVVETGLEAEDSVEASIREITADTEKILIDPPPQASIVQEKPNEVLETQNKCQTEHTDNMELTEERKQHFESIEYQLQQFEDKDQDETMKEVESKPKSVEDETKQLISQLDQISIQKIKDGLKAKLLIKEPVVPKVEKVEEKEEVMQVEEPPVKEEPESADTKAFEKDISKIQEETSLIEEETSKIAKAIARLTGKLDLKTETNEKDVKDNDVKEETQTIPPEQKPETVVLEEKNAFEAEIAKMDKPSPKKKSPKKAPKTPPLKKAEPKPKAPKVKKTDKPTKTANKEPKPKAKPVKEKKAQSEIKPPKETKAKEPKPKKPTKKKAEKKEMDPTKKKDDEDEENNEIRRSSRIKSISHLKRKTKGHGLVKSKSDTTLNEGENSENSNSGFTDSEKSTPVASPMPREKPSAKSRKSADNLSKDVQANVAKVQMDIKLFNAKPKLTQDKEVEMRLKQFVHLKENMYLTDRMTCKEAKKMACDCFLTEEEIAADEYGCGDDCLNRLLMIECGNLCQVGDRCTNKRFQKGQFAPVEVFNTEKKGLGLRAAANIAYGEFILEYVGEVLDSDEFDKRAEHYSVDKNIHYYFMSLRADAIIDATMKGNISRFINHSCDPNAETQKWTVNGELRIGFFSTRTILAGEEITFDYRFQRYGKEAQKCYCESALCRGWLGERPDSSDEEDEEEEEDEDGQTESKKDTVKMETGVDIKDKSLEEPDEHSDSMNESLQDVSKTETSPASEKKTARRKPRKDLLEDMDSLDEDIDLLVETGLKNQAHTLKLSRFMVRAKEMSQRAKLLRVLRRGELPCRRLFLDYHGLRLMHGYMIDAQRPEKKYEQCRLELLQTLAMLPIPNKTMLQDSKVLSTVENWSTGKSVTSPDSDSNSPKDQDTSAKDNEPDNEADKTSCEEEIVSLATKLLEEWSNLKEVFRIPKKERIEQMKEHEREANKKYMLNAEHDNRLSGRSRDRWGNKYDKDDYKKRRAKLDERDRALSMYKITKQERRKLFALQEQLKEEERRRKQREMWREHEKNCLLIGADPRFTAPFDPSRGFQYVWNQSLGQWQNIPIPADNEFRGQNIPPTMQPNLNQPLPDLSVPPPQLSKSANNYPSFGIQPLGPPPMPYQGKQQAPGTPGPVQQSPSSLPYQPSPGQSYQQPSCSMEGYSTPTEEVEVTMLGTVKFLGPIPPPAKLPTKWRCAKDKYGRPYYYHIVIRKSQWEPPPLDYDEEEESSEVSTSTSESSSGSSDGSSDGSDSDDEIDDTKLLLQVRKQMEQSIKTEPTTPTSPVPAPAVDSPTFSPEEKVQGSDDEGEEQLDEEPPQELDESGLTSIDIRLKEQFDFLKEDKVPPTKKRRVGLVQEIIISPRTEEDRLQFKEDLKRYKHNKEKLKREREQVLLQSKKQAREGEPKKREKKLRSTVKARIKEMTDLNSEAAEVAKKIKESFRSNMATTVVSVLNAYRKPDCKKAQITNTDDFKHLARKLTHFVMLKEMKHIARIEDLTCTDNVKSKAREYIRKYMSKFGETYQKRADEPDFKD